MSHLHFVPTYICIFLLPCSGTGLIFVPKRCVNAHRPVSARGVKPALCRCGGLWDAGAGRTSVPVTAVRLPRRRAARLWLGLGCEINLKHVMFFFFFFLLLCSTVISRCSTYLTRDAAFVTFCFGPLTAVHFPSHRNHVLMIFSFCSRPVISLKMYCRENPSVTFILT